jgi:ankyrin repeat protein
LGLLKKLFLRSLQEAAEAGNTAAVLRELRRPPSQSTKDMAFLSAVANNHLEAARILLEHRANINASDADGCSALRYACGLPGPPFEMLQWLVENGADVNASANDGMTPETGHTALCSAATFYDYRIAAVLLRAGADPNALSPDGSPLHIACSSGFKYTDDIFQKYGGNVVSLLLEYGANPNLPEQFEAKTPLHSACQYHHPSEIVEERYRSIVLLLLASGADSSVRDRDGKTPRDHAEALGHFRIAKVLRDAVQPKPVTLQ